MLSLRDKWRVSLDGERLSLKQLDFRCDCFDNDGDLDGAPIHRFSRRPREFPRPFAFWDGEIEGLSRNNPLAAKEREVVRLAGHPGREVD